MGKPRCDLAWQRMYSARNISLSSLDECDGGLGQRELHGIKCTLCTKQHVIEAARYLKSITHTANLLSVFFVRARCALRARINSTAMCKYVYLYSNRYTTEDCRDSTAEAQLLRNVL